MLARVSAGTLRCCLRALALCISVPGCGAVGAGGPPPLGLALAVASPPRLSGTLSPGPWRDRVASAPPRLGRPHQGWAGPEPPQPRASYCARVLQTQQPEHLGKKRCPGSCKFLILPSYFCDERYIQRG